MLSSDSLDVLEPLSTTSKISFLFFHVLLCLGLLFQLMFHLEYRAIWFDMSYFATLIAGWSARTFLLSGLSLIVCIAVVSLIFKLQEFIEPFYH